MSDCSNNGKKQARGVDRPDPPGASRDRGGRMDPMTQMVFPQSNQPVSLELQDAHGSGFVCGYA